MHTYLIYWLSSLALTPFLKSPRTNAAYFLFALIFVGTRYETGFDWPVYKEYFSALAEMNSPKEVYSYANFFGIEFLFALELWLFTFFTSSYEPVQFLITALYLLSFHFLAATIKLGRPAYALAIASTFLLLTLEFSTARQLVALSLFNFAIGLSLNNRPYTSSLLFAACVLNQYSTIIYVCCFAATGTKTIQTIILKNYVFLTAGLSILGTTIIATIAIVSPFFSRKLLYYNTVGFQNTVSIRVLCILACIMLIIHLTATHLKNNPPENARRLMSTTINLGIFAAGFVCTSVLRDRIFYEIIVLFGLTITLQTYPLARFIRPGIASVGILYSMILYLKFPEKLVFVPYQNSIVMQFTDSKADSDTRNQQFKAFFEDAYR